MVRQKDKLGLLYLNFNHYKSVSFGRSRITWVMK